MPSLSRIIKEKIKRKLEYFRLLRSGSFSHLKKEIFVAKKWLGNDYGGFFVATDYLDRNSIVYSIGIGEDISFDRAVYKKFGCKVFAFDPTPKSVRWIDGQQLPERFSFYPLGISNFSGKTTFFFPKNPDFVSGSLLQHTNVSTENGIEVEVKTLADLAAQFGHTKIDVLKMDIEGSEYEVLEDLLEDGPEIGQILVEFHDRFFPDGKQKTIRTLELLKRKGFLIFGVSETFDEVSFIHSNLIKK